MRLHLLGIPHTITSEAASHCAFTSKVYKFPFMMKSVPGYEIIHYGNGERELVDIPCEHVCLIERDEMNKLRGHDGSDPTKFVGDDGNAGSPLYLEFNRRLRFELRDRATQADLVLAPFGHGHTQAIMDCGIKIVESGIGYPILYPTPYKVFESYAWMHWHQGKADRQGNSYEWVVPNYFNIDDWDVELEPDFNRIAFLGRITPAKGLDTIVELAKRRPDLHFEICGQGDPTTYLAKAKNISYHEPLVGRERSAYLGNARCVLMPTTFTEPFGGVAVEAMMCGTPVLASPFGAFTETIVDGQTGFLCHTLGDYLAAIDRAFSLNRSIIALRARELYGFARVAKMYDRVFKQIDDLRGDGWYGTNSVLKKEEVSGFCTELRP